MPLALNNWALVDFPPFYMWNHFCDLLCIQLFPFRTDPFFRRVDGVRWGGWVWQMCRVSYVIGASNWYWLPFGQGLLSFWQARVEGKCFYFFSFFTFIPVPLSSLSLSFISSTISSISFLPFSGRRHKMTHKGWRVVKPQHNQSVNQSINQSINQSVNQSEGRQTILTELLSLNAYSFTLNKLLRGARSKMLFSSFALR